MTRPAHVSTRSPRTARRTLKLAASALALAAGLAAGSEAAAQTRTPWQMHRGLEQGPFASPYDDLVPVPPGINQHGAIAFYNYAGPIPAPNDAGWGPAPDGSTIGFSIFSRLCNHFACLQGADFTYFQTFVDVPQNTVLTTFTISFSGMDDGSRITVINSAYPAGLVVPGSYVFLGGSGTSNLAPYIMAGEINRVVVTQVDDCCSGNNLQSAVVVLNGQVVVTNPDTDNDGHVDVADNCPNVFNPDQADVDNDGIGDACDPDNDNDGVPNAQDKCPGYNDNIDTDGDGTPDGCDLCPLDANDDSDGDGVCDGADICHGFNDHVDTDADGIPDGCDPCMLDPNNDADGDGVCGNVDNCEGVYNPSQNDFDHDGFGDACDARCESRYASADAYVAKTQWSNNFPTGALGLGVQGPEVHEVLLKFAPNALIPPNAIVVSGTLYLYEYSATGGVQPIEVALAHGPWSESTVTWASFGSPNVGPVIGVGNNLASTGLFTIPITQSFVASDADNGIVLTQDVGHSILYSREAAFVFQQPRLKLCFYTVEQQGGHGQ